MLRSRAKLQLKDYTSGTKMEEAGSSAPNLSAFIVSDFGFDYSFPFSFSIFLFAIG